MQQIDSYLTRHELADVLKVTPRTVHNYVKNGLLPEPLKVGRRLLWGQAELFKFLEAAQGKGERANAA